MKTFFSSTIAAAVLGVSLLATGCHSVTVGTEAASREPVNLKVGEGFVEPMGYYESKPRFSWQLPQQSTSNFQSAYQIQVASSEKYIEEADLWDSHKIEDSSTSWVAYQGVPLNSRQQLFWRVRSWNEHHQVSAWSDIHSVELGLLQNTDWLAQWIGHPDTALGEKPSRQLIATPQYFRKTFELESNVRQARLYVTAKGLFKPFINGQSVAAKDVMTPGWTPYSKRIETLTYDVTAMLKDGDNALATSLAGGWYSGRVFEFFETDHVLPPRLLVQLEIEYDNGNTKVIASDKSWKVSQNGPITFASTYDGESYDQSLEMVNWKQVDFNDNQWADSTVEPLDANVKLRPKRHAPIRVIDTLQAVEVFSSDQGVAVFDMGQNMVGVPQLRVPVIEGQKVTIRYAEALQQGKFYTENYRSAKVTDSYNPNQTGDIDYTPTFTYRGFRYVEVSGFDATQVPKRDWVSGLVQHSDFELLADFDSSHSKLNKLSENIVWGLRGNFYDIPLDCPQRDERLGWTGDAQVFVTPSMYMADVYGFWSAWLESVREEQGPDGKIPLYIPFVKWIDFASSGWGDAVTIIPWELYQMTGDETVLSDNYQMMRQWLNYHQLQMKEDRSSMMTFGD